MKNVNPWDAGNDLPDMEISRQVMLNKPVKEIEALNDEGERIYPDLSNQEDFDTTLNLSSKKRREHKLSLFFISLKILFRTVAFIYVTYQS